MVSPPLLQYIVEHARELVLENASLLLILSILNYSLGMLYKYNGFNVAVNANLHSMHKSVHDNHEKLSCKFCQNGGLTSCITKHNRDLYMIYTGILSMNKYIKQLNECACIFLQRYICKYNVIYVTQVIPLMP